MKNFLKSLASIHVVMIVIGFKFIFFKTSVYLIKGIFYQNFNKEGWEDKPF